MRLPPENHAMMPKVVLKAPPGVGGQIHASATQNVYVIDAQGEVTVDAADVTHLLGAGYFVKPHDGTPATETPVPITSDAVGSDTLGATALDPAQREAGHRASPEEQDLPANHQDHGAASPPHSVVPPGGGTGPNPAEAARQAGDAALEAQAREQAGSDPAAAPSIKQPGAAS